MVRAGCASPTCAPAPRSFTLETSQWQDHRGAASTPHPSLVTHHYALLIATGQLLEINPTPSQQRRKHFLFDTNERFFGRLYRIESLDSPSRPSGEWPTRSGRCVGRSTTDDNTTTVVDLEVDWFLGLPLILHFRVPHSRRRRGCATVAQAMPDKLERRYARRQLYFIACRRYRRRPLPGNGRKRDAFAMLHPNPHPSHETNARRVIPPPKNREMLNWAASQAWSLAHVPAFDPAINGAPGGIRTPDPLLRRQTLFPTELRALSP